MLLGASGALAQVSPTITVGPARAVPSSIPTLSTGALVALALLMAVVAFRLLRQNETGSKFLGVVVAGSIALLAAVGANTTDAGGLSAVIAASECSSNKVIDMTSNRNASTNSIRNDCSVDFRIVSYDLQCDIGQTLPSEFFDNGSPVGTVIAAGSTLANVGYCRRSELD